MATKNPRINITFEKSTAGLLVRLAQKERKSVAGLVRELTIDALEKREDLFLSKLAKEIDKKGARTYGHSAAWK